MRNYHVFRFVVRTDIRDSLQLIHKNTLLDALQQSGGAIHQRAMEFMIVANAAGFSFSVALNGASPFRTLTNSLH